MSDSVMKVKVTVLKRMFNADLVQEYLDAGADYGVCSKYRDGQEFIVERPWNVPEGFCTWAWADIRNDLLTIMSGGNLPWIKQRGVNIVSCTDVFRPVIFKIERVK